MIQPNYVVVLISPQLNVTWVWGETPPAVLRYAWADYPVMKLYNAHGMPAPPFVLSLPL